MGNYAHAALLAGLNKVRNDVPLPRRQTSSQCPFPFTPFSRLSFMWAPINLWARRPLRPFLHLGTCPVELFRHKFLDSRGRCVFGAFHLMLNRFHREKWILSTRRSFQSKSKYIFLFLAMLSQTGWNDLKTIDDRLSWLAPYVLTSLFWCNRVLVSTYWCRKQLKKNCLKLSI